ncbi:hypothetical protein PSCICG_42910 [Pseudomonas cichorii]|nr:hypothetical protein PSCICG_42910 [Pseudomonas cichorii]
MEFHNAAVPTVQHIEMYYGCHLAINAYSHQSQADSPSEGVFYPSIAMRFLEEDIVFGIAKDWVVNYSAARY